MKPMLRIIAFAATVAAVVFGVYAWIDWGALQSSYAEFESLARHSHDFSALFVADSLQNAHRVNLAAEGVWTLLSTILAVVSVKASSGAKEVP